MRGLSSNYLTLTSISTRLQTVAKCEYKVRTYINLYVHSSTYVVGPVGASRICCLACCLNSESLGNFHDLSFRVGHIRCHKAEASFIDDICVHASHETWHTHFRAEGGWYAFLTFWLVDRRGPTRSKSSEHMGWTKKGLHSSCLRHERGHCVGSGDGANCITCCIGRCTAEAFTVSCGSRCGPAGSRLYTRYETLAGLTPTGMLATSK